MTLANADLRYAAKENGIRLWQVADVAGISETTMTRRLRRELPEAEKQKLLNIIERLSASRAESR